MLLYPLYMWPHPTKLVKTCLIFCQRHMKENLHDVKGGVSETAGLVVGVLLAGAILSDDGAPSGDPDGKWRSHTETWPGDRWVAM